MDVVVPEEGGRLVASGVGVGAGCSSENIQSGWVARANESFACTKQADYV